MDKTELGCLRAIVLFNPGGLRTADVGLLLSCPSQRSTLTIRSFLQMQKDFPNPVKWRCSERRSMHHWRPTANRDTQSSREGKGAMWTSSTQQLLRRHWPELNAAVLSSVSTPHRFAKLLLRLPALRSIGLKCLEHLFFFKLIGDTPIDTFLMEMLEAPHHLS